MSFLEAELRTTGSLDSYHKLKLNGRFVPKNLDEILERYAGKFPKLLNDFISIYFIPSILYDIC